VCVIANEDVLMLIEGCQLRQVSLARDGASWAVSCPGFGQASPGQGQAAVRAVVAGSAQHLPDLGPQAPQRPLGSGSGVLLRGPQPPAQGSRDAGRVGTGVMLPLPAAIFSSPRSSHTKPAAM